MWLFAAGCCMQNSCVVCQRKTFCSPSDLCCHSGVFSQTHFPLSSWECNTTRKLLICEELVGRFSNYSAPSNSGKVWLYSPTKVKTACLLCFHVKRTVTVVTAERLKVQNLISSVLITLHLTWLLIPIWLIGISFFNFDSWWSTLLSLSLFL